MSENIKITVQNRRYNLDIVRCYACVMVVLIHVVAIDWYIDPNLDKWKLYNLFDMFARCGVPLFFMLSGILFLEKEKLCISRFLSHNIFRLVKLWLVWSIFYESYLQLRTHTYSGIKEFLTGCINGHYHLWFLPTLIMVYLIFPIIHEGIHNNSLNVKYCLVLFGAIIFRQNLIILPNKSDLLNAILEKTNFTAAIIYTGYAVLGYYLSKKKYGKNARILSCLIYIVVSIAGAYGNWWYSIYYNGGEAAEWLYNYFSIPTCIQAVCVLCFFLSFENIKWRGWKYLSSCTLGVYLVHPFIIENCAYKGISVANGNPLITVPIMLIIMLIGSLIITVLIKKIPIVNRYM